MGEKSWDAGYKLWQSKSCAGVVNKASSSDSSGGISGLLARQAGKQVVEGGLTSTELGGSLISTIFAMMNGVTDQVFGNAVMVVAQEAFPAAMLHAFLEGGHHHLEPVLVRAPGICDIFQCQEICFRFDCPNAARRVLA